MAYEIKQKKSVDKDLRKIPTKQQVRIEKKINERLKTNPYQYPKLTADSEGKRRLRVGEYRVFYVIKEKTVLITEISPRQGAYK